MFIDTKSPNGLLFIAKQQLLSRTAVRTQTSGRTLNEGIYSPLNTLAQAGLVAFGTHLTKQGLNPFAQTGAYAYDNKSLYFNKVKANPNDPSGSTASNRLVEIYNTKQSVKNINDNVIVYTGGPGSILGIGKTGIRFADQRTGNNNAQKIANSSYFNGKNQQRSVDSSNNLVGGLQINWLKPWTKQNIYHTPSGNIASIGLPNSNVNTPQSASLSKIPDGELTWTPNQKLADGRKWNNLAVSSSIKSKNTSSVSQAYEQSNKQPLGIPTTPGDKVYLDSVGVNSKLFNLNAEGAQTWTSNQSNPDSSKYYKTLTLIGDQFKNKGVSGKYSRLTNEPINNYFNFLGAQIDTYNHNVYNPISGSDTWPKNSPLINAQNTYTYTQKDIIQTGDNTGKLTSSPTIQDFRATLRANATKNPQNKFNEAKQSGQLAESLDYNIDNFEQRVNIGNPGQRGAKDYFDYAKGVRIQNSDTSPYGNIGGTPAGLDKINSLPIYRSENVNTDYPVNDFVKFRIAVIDNDAPNFKTFMHFRTFLGPISDSYNANWNSFQYLGRGENFYTYGGFTRQISLSWTVAAQSKEELIPMYKKLNYLASTLAPDYSPNGYMRGNLVQLTIGGYLYEQPGFITGLTYEMGEDSPWEIGIGTEKTNPKGDPTVKELCQIIRVTGFSFTPIQNFVPRLQSNSFGSDATGFAETYGPERFIALNNGISNNYNN
jgi:hypothetical protein